MVVETMRRQHVVSSAWCDARKLSTSAMPTRGYDTEAGRIREVKMQWKMFKEEESEVQTRSIRPLPIVYSQKAYLKQELSAPVVRLFLYLKSAVAEPCRKFGPRTSLLVEGRREPHLIHLIAPNVSSSACHSCISSSRLLFPSRGRRRDSGRCCWHDGRSRGNSIEVGIQ